MAVISFWSNGRGEIDKSSAVAAVTTFLAIHRNLKILILDTKHNNYSYQDCYWKEDKTIKLIHGGSIKTNIASGISGLSKAILSHKTSPEIITNYTQIVFKDRLEVLTDTNVMNDDYENYKKVLKEVVKIANKYYDLVFIDIDNEIDGSIVSSLLENSDLIVANIPQKKRQIDEFLKIKKGNIEFKGKKVITLIEKFDTESKYTVKNITRYMKEKNKVCVIPYNTLFFEACSEGKVADFFIKFRNINQKDKNAIFMEGVKNTAETILEKLKELQMRM